MHPYHPLDSSNGEIRLLDIQPAKQHEAAIVCKLRHAYLSKKPSYECLSYVWGKEEGGIDIELDNTSFHVFENCEAALRRLRDTRTSRTVWIDAICINQKDNDEKGAQVSRMQDIYHEARQVCVWLGESSSGSIVAVKSIQKRLTTGWHLWNIDRKFGKPTLSFRESLKSSIMMQNRSSLVVEQEFGEINELLDRPWFTRVWIMQEAVLARKLILMCGSETMDWDALGAKLHSSFMARNFSACFGMRTNPWDLFCDETYQTISHFRKDWAAGGWNASIYQLLYNYRHLNCKWPHDRIYGFLGLAPMAKALSFGVDYNMKTDEVFISFTRTVIQKTNCLDILHCVREWRSPHVPFEDKPAIAYSLLEQSRYHDIHALITDGSEHPLRRGWARLPPGWERIQDEGQPSYFCNHNDGSFQEQSPLEFKGAVPTRYHIEQRTLPRGWAKDWNNVGQAKVMFFPAILDANYHLDQVERLEKHGLHKLPSWTPNWDAKIAYDPTPLLDWSDLLPRYWAAKGLPVTVMALEDDINVLGLEGFVFDVVDSMACSWHPKSNLGPFSRKGIDELEIWEALAIIEVLDCPYKEIGGRKSALWRTLIADYAGDRREPDTKWLFIETWYDRVGWQPDLPNLTSKGLSETAALHNGIKDMEVQMMTHYINLRATTPEFTKFATNASTAKIIKDSVSQGFKLSKEYGTYVRRIRRACAHRAMYVTSKGYMGLAPWNAQEGDLVCILKGGKTPFLLRLPPAGSVYQLVGETYVHGIMGGEAIADDAQGNDWRVFNLR